MYEYHATFIRAIDGDTVELLIDQGLDNFRKIQVRLLVVNTKELNSKDPADRLKALNAKAFVEEELTGKRLFVRTIKDRTDGWKRYLAEIYVVGEVDSISTKLLAAGLADLYER